MVVGVRPFAVWPLANKVTIIKFINLSTSVEKYRCKECYTLDGGQHSRKTVAYVAFNIFHLLAIFMFS